MGVNVNKLWNALAMCKLRRLNKIEFQLPDAFATHWQVGGRFSRIKGITALGPM
jgi:hypothetical protein